jgi:uncharacterized repeat protein (TIGR03803 family)
MDPSGRLTTLYSFGGTDWNASDGIGPTAPLVQGSDGNFYGTTENGGGTGNDCIAGCGTVFALTPTGILTSLHRFDGIDGSSPVAGLVQASNGYFYGTTSGIGSFNNSYGTVYRVGVVPKCTACRP